MNFVKNLFFLITSPQNGWQAIGKYYVPMSIIQNKFLYPLIGLLALTSFVQLFYNAEYTVMWAIVNVIICFVAYLITYFACLYFVPFFFQSIMDSNDLINRFSIYVTYNLSFLVVISIIRGLLPSEFLPLLFFVLYVIYIMYKGLDFIKFEGNAIALISVLSAMMIVIPPFFIWLLNKIL